MLIHFCVAFISDVVLNDLTRFNMLKPLQPYFYQQSIIKCAFDAGLTVLVALVITMFFSYALFGFVVPSQLKQLLSFSLLAFVVGYILDVLIYKFKVFGNRLNEYYKAYGAGLWGSLAFVFSIAISYMIQKYVLGL